MKDYVVTEHGLQLGLSVKTGVTLVAGDMVRLSASEEVAKATVGCPFAIGRVIVTTAGVINNSKVTIRTQYGSLKVYTAGEAIIAGPVVMGADGKVYNWTKNTADGSQTITFATNATGDGDHTMTIAGETITYTPAGSATPTTVATAVTALILANLVLRNMGIYATSSSGVVTVKALGGKIADGLGVVVSTTDSTQTVVAGAATITGGAGYPESAIFGISTKSVSSAGECPVLTKE